MTTRTVIEYTDDVRDRLHGVGHYEVVHQLGGGSKPICGKDGFRASKRGVTSKRIFRLPCLRCSRGDAEAK